MRDVIRLFASALLLAASARGEKPPSDPRGILRPRVARWECELPKPAKETFGAEPNPAGNPIGGGPGYKDIVTRGDFVARTYDELRAALQRAKSGQVVFIPGGVEIDMTGKQRLVIPGGVTVASDRGRDGSKGALLYITTARPLGLLAAGGDYVRITGLRVRGPHPGVEPAPDSMGLRAAHFATEIDNCEVWAFTCPAISVAPGARRAYVHHCFIHHNQRTGLGYGVSINDADVLVEACRFDYGRHYITCSNGTPGTGYEARYNVCGPHCIGHLFDVHGEASGSGIGGEWFNIHHNTFLASKQHSIGIRGVPSQGVWVHHNWFQDPDTSKAMFVIDYSFGSPRKAIALWYLAGLLGRGNAHMERNVFGKERKLVVGFPFDDYIVRATYGRVRSTWRSLKLSEQDLIDIYRILRTKWKPRSAPAPTKPLDRLTREELIQLIRAYLQQAARSQETRLAPP